MLLETLTTRTAHNEHDAFEIVVVSPTQDGIFESLLAKRTRWVRPFLAALHLRVCLEHVLTKVDFRFELLVTQFASVALVCNHFVSAWDIGE